MRHTRIIPLAALLLAAACSESPTAPLAAPEAPSFDQTESPFGWTLLPTSGCTVNSDQSLSCTWELAELAEGALPDPVDVYVGGRWAYTYQCLNKGGKPLKKYSNKRAFFDEWTHIEGAAATGAEIIYPPVAPTSLCNNVKGAAQTVILSGPTNVYWEVYAENPSDPQYDWVCRNFNGTCG